MSKKKTDPRILRTRHLIINAFIQLSEKKEFEDITVKDISEEAWVNRATFYNHFLDKYDLMEQALYEEVSINLSREEFIGAEADEVFIVKLFSALSSFQSELAVTCQRSYQKTINQLVNDQLFVIHQQRFLESHPEVDPQEAKKVSVMFAASMLNLARVWQTHGNEGNGETAEEFIQQALPYLIMLMQPATSDKVTPA